LTLSDIPCYSPPVGTRCTVCESPAGISQTLTLVDKTGLGLELVASPTKLEVVSTRPAPGIAGEIWIEDDFTTQDAIWDDLSIVPMWGSPRRNASAFEWTDSVVRLVRSGERDTTGFTAYNELSSLKTFTALDYQFDTPVDHATNEVTLDFRMRWPVIEGGSGEGGRVIFAFNYDYPEGGLDLTPEGQPGSRIRDFSGVWWARPAYHIRLRNSDTRSGSTFLQYGGGSAFAGEYERTPSWWLPGFISGAGSKAPGDGEDFPANSWVSTRTGMASTQFTTFRYRILPDRQELWRDDNDDGVLTEDELKATMPLPAASPESPFYTWFEVFEGLRIFWNGRGDETGQAEIDWLRLVVQPNLSPIAQLDPEPLFASVLVDGKAHIHLDASATNDPEGDDLTYYWFLGTALLDVSRVPGTFLPLPEGEHLVELVVRDSAGNTSYASRTVTVSLGKARPVAEAGPEQVVTAANEWFGTVTLDATASLSPDGQLVRFQWFRDNGTRLLYDGPDPIILAGLEVGSHVLSLLVWDENGNIAEDSVRIIVESSQPPQPETVVYRENFSRPASGGEMHPRAVGWQLMSFDGNPVPEVKYDGNAHRSLSGDSYSGRSASKVNANPTGEEYDILNANGHMWMNQMPFQNASPSEWFLWTDEYPVSRSGQEISKMTFQSTDSSPEHVKVSPALRIDDKWYIGWDMRVETSGGWWRDYSIEVQDNGWYLFEPSPIFTIRDATLIGRLPDGDVDAFGVFFYKDYGWYVNEFDNLTLYTQPKQVVPPFASFLTGYFPAIVLADGARDAGWRPYQDYDGDGFSNMLEYLGDSDPTERRSQPADLVRIEPTTTQIDLVVTNTEAMSGLSMILWKSNDLKTWSKVPHVAHERLNPLTGSTETVLTTSALQQNESAWYRVEFANSEEN